MTPRKADAKLAEHQSDGQLIDAWSWHERGRAHLQRDLQMGFIIFVGAQATPSSAPMGVV